LERRPHLRTSKEEGGVNRPSGTFRRRSVPWDIVMNLEEWNAAGRGKKTPKKNKKTKKKQKPQLNIRGYGSYF